MKGHSGGIRLFRKGAEASKSRKYMINYRRSTESEIIGVDDHLSGVFWMLRFLGGQDLKVNNNIVYQDNQSTILMERNGKYSCRKKTCHIDLRYLFITDQIKQKEVSVKYSPTEEMDDDYFTKPLQEALLRRYRSKMMKLEYLSK